MLIFNANQLNSLQEIFVTVLILYPTLIFLAFRAYLLEPSPQDYITKGKTMKKYQNSNEVRNGCTRSRIRIGIYHLTPRSTLNTLVIFYWNFLLGGSHL